MFATLLDQLQNVGTWVVSPLGILSLGFSIWMFVDAIRRQEWIWAICIFFFNIFSALMYFVFVYRQAASLSTRGFELPGAHQRQRVKELQAKIHHLDKAHHHSQLGDVYFQQGKLPEAEKSYRAALERDPADIDTRAHLGQCLLRANRAADALPFLQGVVSEDPKHDYGHSLMALAESYTSLSQIDLSIATWQRVVENHSYPRARVQLAELYLGQNQPQLAKALLQEVLVEDPHAPAFQRRRDRVWVRRAKSLARRDSRVTS